MLRFRQAPTSATSEYVVTLGCLGLPRALGAHRGAILLRHPDRGGDAGSLQELAHRVKACVHPKDETLPPTPPDTVLSRGFGRPRTPLGFCMFLARIGSVRAVSTGRPLPTSPVSSQQELRKCLHRPAAWIRYL